MMCLSTFFSKAEFDGEAPQPIRYEPWAVNPQLLGPSTGTAAMNPKL